MDIQTFTQGKNTLRNEDSFGYNETTVVIADGATGKNDYLFEGKTGGEILSRFVVDKTLECASNGIDLIHKITSDIQELYKEIHPEALHDSSKRFKTTLVCVRILDNKVIVTQVGDSMFRINGKDLYKNDKLIDELNAQVRSLYIKKTQDVPGSRDYILPLLQHQYKYQNNPDSVLGYGSINGTEVPEQFIKTFEFDRAEIKTIELITDGYFAIPSEVSIEAYEQEYQRIEQEDPNKCISHLSTKSKDDRTVLILTLNK